MTEKEWTDLAAAKLVGKTITNVRYLTDLEMKHLGWYHSTLMIFFDSGEHIYASADDEGNDAGALFTSFKDLPTIPVI